MGPGICPWATSMGCNVWGGLLRGARRSPWPFGPLPASPAPSLLASLVVTDMSKWHVQPASW
eukprot:884118-Lingulodinium_polyedra.AAC.1